MDILVFLIILAVIFVWIGTILKGWTVRKSNLELFAKILNSKWRYPLILPFYGVLRGEYKNYKFEFQDWFCDPETYNFYLYCFLKFPFEKPNNIQLPKNIQIYKRRSLLYSWRSGSFFGKREKGDIENLKFFKYTSDDIMKILDELVEAAKLIENKKTA